MEWRGCRSNKRNKFLLIYALVGYRFWPQPLQQNNSFLPLSANFLKRQVNLFFCLINWFLFNKDNSSLLFFAGASTKRRQERWNGILLKERMEWSSLASEGWAPAITHNKIKKEQQRTNQLSSLFLMARSGPTKEREIAFTYRAAGLLGAPFTKRKTIHSFLQFANSRIAFFPKFIQVVFSLLIHYELSLLNWIPLPFFFLFASSLRSMGRRTAHNRASSSPKEEKGNSIPFNSRLQ